MQLTDSPKVYLSHLLLTLIWLNKMAHPESFEEKVRWFLVAAYVCNCLEELDVDKQLKLAHLAEQYGGENTWQELVESDLSIDEKMINGIYNFCTRHRSHGHSLLFILRGLGCPYPEARLSEIIGNSIDD